MAGSTIIALKAQTYARIVASKFKEHMGRFYTFLDNHVFPAIVAYATHPLVIFLTILLLIPLIFFGWVTTLSLILGNYTNVVSASVSSIVLMQTLKHHHENKRLHAQHAAQINALQEQIAAMQPAQPPKRATKTKKDTATNGK